MASMTFRFSGECELRIYGASYEDIYLSFKEFMHQQNGLKAQAGKMQLTLLPPDTDTIFFEVEADQEFQQIDMFKGNFNDDILANWPERMPELMHGGRLQ